MAETTAPSTSPIDEALAKLMGTKGPLSKTAGSNPIGYDPSQTFRPTGDTLNISNLGGSGVSTPEQWTHEIQLANLAQQSAQQEYTKQAAAQEFAYKTAQDILANQRASQQLGMQRAEAGRAAALAPAQLQAAQLANRQTQQAMGLARAAEQRAALDSYIKAGGYTLPQLEGIKQGLSTQTTFMRGYPVNSPGALDQLSRYYATGQNPAVSYIPQRSTQQLDWAGQPVNRGLAYGENYYGAPGANPGNAYYYNPAAYPVQGGGGVATWLRNPGSP
jgi:hypothetical protein